MRWKLGLKDMEMDMNMEYGKMFEGKDKLHRSWRESEGKVNLLLKIWHLSILPWIIKAKINLLLFRLTQGRVFI